VPTTHGGAISWPLSDSEDKDCSRATWSASSTTHTVSAYSAPLARYTNSDMLTFKTTSQPIQQTEHALRMKADFGMARPWRCLRVRSRCVRCSRDRPTAAHRQV